MIIAAEALHGLFEETQGEKGGKQTPALFFVGKAGVSFSVYPFRHHGNTGEKGMSILFASCRFNSGPRISSSSKAISNARR